MAYIKRNLERKFLHMSEFFKAVLVTGARQVGKTTMLRQLAKGQNRTYISLDNMMARTLAQTDPVLFFQTYKPPIIIDEVQYAPQLFHQIKIICDESQETGLFWLTGSQQYGLMQGVQESLAGRIGILTLYGFSENEKKGISFLDALDFSLANLQQRSLVVPKVDIVEVFGGIWRGGMPQVQAADGEQRQEYYHSYINTYILRDVAALGGAVDGVKFVRFLTACAALVSEQLNYKALADAADISQPTAKAWIQLLQGLGVIYLLQPYANNELKRITKTPKLYFCDTGLCAHLSMWLTKETLMVGAASGHYFENHVVLELLKYYATSKVAANLTYYRDSNAKEIDLFVEVGGAVHPLEIKKSANPNQREVKKFQVLDKGGVKRGYGGILCMCEAVIPIDPENAFIPCNVI